MDIEATNSVQALARAFGAGQKMDALLSPMSYNEAVAEGDRLFASLPGGLNHNSVGSFVGSGDALPPPASPASPMSMSFPSASLPSRSNPGGGAGAGSRRRSDGTTRVVLLGRPRSASNASSHPPLPSAHLNSAAIEIEHVQYLGHMEVVSNKVSDLAVKCEEMLGKLVGTSPATIAVRYDERLTHRHVVFEFTRGP